MPILGSILGPNWHLFQPLVAEPEQSSTFFCIICNIVTTRRIGFTVWLAPAVTVRDSAQAASANKQTNDRNAAIAARFRHTSFLGKTDVEICGDTKSAMCHHAGEAAHGVH